MARTPTTNTLMLIFENSLNKPDCKTMNLWRRCSSMVEKNKRRHAQHDGEKEFNDVMRSMLGTGTTSWRMDAGRGRLGRDSKLGGT
jgi:hypothetical protein